MLLLHRSSGRWGRGGREVGVRGEGERRLGQIHNLATACFTYVVVEGTAISSGSLVMCSY